MNRTLPPTSLPPTSLPRSGVAGVTRLADHATLFGVSLEPDQHPTQGALALSPPWAGGVEDLPAAPGLRLVAGSASPVKAWAVRFAQALVEVVSGDRTPHQLLRCTSADVHARIVDRCSVLNGVSRPDQRRRRVRSHVRSVHCFQPDPATAEVSVHVRQGERSRALALRVEHLEGRWVCTAVEFG
ncbi:hypothetical protein D9V37_08360 [Nocardioides mangrovicus]|uniref:3-hydroxyacyl-CoA dehydrogenase n=1 Tax=Nocardioides mangrovicus TaxID=2478913 RepID=A0A3L8P4C2_9ACTN|nr:Rv3235 family protein [Nocardioides mangrovicus]RLV49887.1 hypothetical protein D9V37_08360 [Nocardioides mangrovicus]